MSLPLFVYDTTSRFPFPSHYEHNQEKAFRFNRKNCTKRCRSDKNTSCENENIDFDIYWNVMQNLISLLRKFIIECSTKIYETTYLLFIHIFVISWSSRETSPKDLDWQATITFNKTTFGLQKKTLLRQFQTSTYLVLDSKILQNR